MKLQITYITAHPQLRYYRHSTFYIATLLLLALAYCTYVYVDTRNAHVFGDGVDIQLFTVTHVTHTEHTITQIIE